MDICSPQVSPSVDKFNQVKAYHDGRLLLSGQEANRLSVFAMPEGCASGKPCRGEISIESMPPRIVEHQSEGVVTGTEDVTNRLKNGAILATEGHLSKGSNRHTVTYEWRVKDTWPVRRHRTESSQGIADMTLKYPLVTSRSKD